MTIHFGLISEIGWSFHTWPAQEIGTLAEIDKEGWSFMKLSGQLVSMYWSQYLLNRMRFTYSVHGVYLHACNGTSSVATSYGIPASWLGITTEDSPYTGIPDFVFWRQTGATPRQKMKRFHIKVAKLDHKSLIIRPGITIRRLLSVASTPTEDHGNNDYLASLVVKGGIKGTQNGAPGRQPVTGFSPFSLPKRLLGGCSSFSSLPSASRPNEGFWRGFESSSGSLNATPFGNSSSHPVRLSAVQLPTGWAQNGAKILDSLYPFYI